MEVTFRASLNWLHNWAHTWGPYLGRCDAGEASPIAVMVNTVKFVSGLRVIQFRHWSLRSIYFALRLGGCLMIATGLLFWLDSRRKWHAQLGLRGAII